tara:strand:+ start:634 stop:1620 length:987 start_codon:yes stop_codon:yes gene_type:complete
MAFSGTVSQTTFDTRRVIENAARRCKMPPQTLTSEHVDVANDQLYLLLSDLSNRGIQLWCIERSIYPLYEGTSQLITYEGTVDILNSNLRSIQPVSGVVYTDPMYRETQFTDPTTVSVVGVKWGSASVPLVLQRSDDGLTWTSIQTEERNVTAGQWTWFDVSPVVAATYFRVMALSGTPVFTEVVLGNSPTEIPLARLSRDDYTNLPNKTFTSNRPLQYWLDRQALSPVMNLWPVPNASAEHMQIIVWAQRHIMDVGTMQQQIEVPQRWYEAIVAMLAAKLAMEYLEVDPSLIPMLDGKAKEALYFAQQEERDNSPMMILPNISMYTA